MLLAACSATPKQLEAELRRCLTPGRTTFADAVLCLGVPSHAYEDGRILIYPGIIEVSGSPRVLSKPPRFVLGGIPTVSASAVLTFDDRWILQSVAISGTPERHP